MVGFDNIQIVKTARLELRIFHESFLDDFHTIWINPTTTIWTIRGVSPSFEESRIRMAGLLPDPGKPSALNYGVFVRPSQHVSLPSSASSATAVPQPPDRMIGILGVAGVSFPPGTVEVGYVYDESAWGRGYATEALAAYIDIYWDYVKEIDYMVAKVDPENIPSIKVLKKCGFVVVDHLVNDIVLPALGMRDTLVLRIERPRAGRTPALA